MTLAEKYDEIIRQAAEGEIDRLEAMSLLIGLAETEPMDEGDLQNAIHGWNLVLRRRTRPLN